MISRRSPTRTRPLRRYELGVAAACVMLSLACPASAGSSPSTRAAGARGDLSAGLAYVTGSLSSGPTTVWLASANGTNTRKLAPGLAPDLSPNGRLVAVETDVGSTLTVYSSSGAVVGTFFNPTRTVVHASAWAPDSRYLAVVLQPAGGIPHPGAPSLAVIDTRTGKVRTVIHGVVQGLSFAPTRPDRIVYGVAPTTSKGTTGPVNLYTAAAAGGPIKQLTHDGHSLNPVWGTRGIVFDRETPRKHQGLPSYPAYQLFLLSGQHLTRITHMSVFWLGEGLIPAAISGDGTRLAANWFGEDMDRAWSVDLVTHSLHELPAGLTAAGISRDGRRVLLESMYGLIWAPATSKIETMPFSGGRPTMLVTPGGEASWNQ